VLDLGVSEEGDGSIVALSINVASSKSKGIVELKQKIRKTERVLSIVVPQIIEKRRL
jgi:hypothetical protein